MPTVRFEVSCETLFGSRVFIVGNHKSTGVWDPHSSKLELCTNPGTYPGWCISWDYPSGTKLQFKVVVLQPNGHAMWEDRIINRELVVPEDQLQLKMRFNIPQDLPKGVEAAGPQEAQPLELELRAARAEQQAAAASLAAAEGERRAADAERRAAEAEQRATAAGLQAAEAEQCAAEAEQRLAEAERRVAEAERRLEEAERRLFEAERRTTAAEQKAAEAELRATVLAVAQSMGASGSWASATASGTPNVTQWQADLQALAARLRATMADGQGKGHHELGVRMSAFSSTGSFSSTTSTPRTAEGSLPESHHPVVEDEIAGNLWRPSTQASEMESVLKDWVGAECKKNRYALHRASARKVPRLAKLGYEAQPLQEEPSSWSDHLGEQVVAKLLERFRSSLGKEDRRESKPAASAVSFSEVPAPISPTSAERPQPRGIRGEPAPQLPPPRPGTATGWTKSPMRRHGSLSLLPEVAEVGVRKL